MNRASIVLLASVVFSVLSVGAFAQNRDNRGYPPPVDRSASAKARADIARAQADLSKASDEFANIGAVLRRDLENSSEWKSAQMAVKQAQGEFDAARNAVMARLREDPAYMSALRAKEDAEKARDATPDEPSSPRRVEAAKAVLDAGQKVTEMESAAINADPVASGARAALNEAAARLAEINKRFEETMRKDPKYRSAERAVDDARKKLAQAQAALASATQKEAQAERDRQRRIDEIDRRRAQEAARRIRRR